MTTHTAEIQIQASKETVWTALADFGGVWKYNPAVNSSRSLTAANEGVGAERHCDLAFAGAAVDERIVEWDDNGSYVVEIYDGKKLPPIKNVLARLTVKESGGSSIVTAKMDYETKLGPIGSVMDRFMISPKFGKAFSGMLVGLKHHIETGSNVEMSTKLDYDAVRYVAA